MARALHWRDLLGGIAALGGVVVISLLILVFGNVNSLHGKTVRLYAAVGSARGVLRGTEVWLQGKRVGLVNDVAFQPPTVDTLNRLVIAMDVLDEYRGHIRTDAQVQIRAAGSLIGAPVIYVNAGSPQAGLVTDGDTIRSKPQADLETMASKFAGASRDLPAILANLNLLAQQLRGAQGTLGALGIEKSGPALDAVQSRLLMLGERLRSPTGTVGRALGAGPTLGARAQRVLARADSVRQMLATGQARLGRLRTDSSLIKEIESIRDEMTIVRALMKSPSGNLGRFATDSAVFRALGEGQREMALLFRDIRRRPTRYLHF
jgi:hypothetical protein